MSLKNVKGEIEYPYYKHLEMFNDDDNYPSIASILSLDEAIDQKDLSAVYAVLDAH